MEYSLEQSFLNYEIDEDELIRQVYRGIDYSILDWEEFYAKRALWAEQTDLLAKTKREKALMDTEALSSIVIAFFLHKHRPAILEWLREDFKKYLGVEIVNAEEVKEEVEAQEQVDVETFFNFLK